MSPSSLIEFDEAPCDWGTTLIVAVGNPSRGDDAAGPLLAERLSEWLDDEGCIHRMDLAIISDQQLMVEHAYDLRWRDRVLFIDAAARQSEPVTWRRIRSARSGPAISSHQCTPQQLLHLCANTLQMCPPRAWLLSLKGECFELGAPVSEGMRQALDQAWPEILHWIAPKLYA
ncbi:MAG: hydrogenase maturation protease [Aquabacterium sp.]|jgi:hydrogenase maturation protease|uniref:hydrogenase maturation protease n=1 Tax=Aquabacterium sp. TaxID=1872578 RepID=UPI002A3609C4|nr:hydrogenase maturation protease [Aquabacterium sp.]MDX9842980.1 hydrogenase maturation protease [Aquabacterium sp.]